MHFGILVYSRKLETYITQVCTMLTRLQQHQLQVKVGTVNFLILPNLSWNTSLGIRGTGRWTWGDITEWPILNNIKDLQKFLCFANFYQCFKFEITALWQNPTGLNLHKPPSKCFITAPIQHHLDPSILFIVEVKEAMEQELYFYRHMATQAHFHLC